MGGFSLKKSEAVVVAPAAPTPSCLYYLSNLDVTLQFPIEVVVSFQGSPNVNTHLLAPALKAALADVLVDYYPLAGRLVMPSHRKLMLRCTGGDGGVPFVEAVSDDDMRVLGDISIIKPELRQLVHCYPQAQSILDIPPLTLQVTRFRCGGLVMGVAFNHVVMDALSMINFLRSLFERLKGLSHYSLPPLLDRTVLSPRQPPKLSIHHHEYTDNDDAPPSPPPTPLFFRQNPKLQNRSFLFTPQNIAMLRNLATAEHQHFFPTNFELISALVWVNWTKSLKMAPEKTSKFLVAADGRSRLNPPLPRNYFGNVIVCSCAKSTAGELTTKPFSHAVELMHRSIKIIDDEYVRSAIDWVEEKGEGYEYKNTLWITKWSRLPFYDEGELDLGFGQLLQVAPASMVENLVVVTAEGRDSRHLILSLSLPPPTMETFQHHMAEAGIISY